MDDSIAKEEIQREQRLVERWLTPDGMEIRKNILDAVLNKAHPGDWVALLEGLREMEDLRKSEGEPFPRDLRGFDFSKQDLTKADLAHVVLDYANFEGAVLDDARMRGVSLEGANFKRVSMKKAHLWNAMMTRAKLAYADLSEADLGDVNLREADLWWARLDEANLRGADLGDANLSWARMPMADLWGANLAHARLEGVNLMGIKVNTDTQWGICNPPCPPTLSEAVPAFWAAVKSVSPGKIASAFWLTLSSIWTSFWLFLRGKQTPILSLEKDVKTQEERKVVREVYRQVYEACKANGLTDHASWFFYRSQVCRRETQFKRWSFGWIVEYYLFDCLSGYGERPRWVIVTMFSIILIFGVLNWMGGVYGGLIYMGEEFHDIGFWGGLFYSIESFTTVGYGDIIPNHHSLVGKFLRYANALESLTGNLMMALALVTYTRIAIRD